MGGVDLSWLAGGLVAGGVYAVLGPIVARKYDAAAPAAVPVPRTVATPVADLPEAPGVIA
jgi:toxin CptA